MPNTLPYTIKSTFLDGLLLILFNSYIYIIALYSVWLD